jgi:ribosomal-protein-alanine N-acetyltransferase
MTSGFSQTITDPGESGRILPMTDRHLAAVIDLERKLYPFPWTPGNFADALRAGYGAWVWCDDAQAIGAYAVSMMVLDEAHVLNIAVAPSRQRQGLGMHLLNWLADRARANGAQSLLLEVRPSNTDAVRLYQRFGFRQIGVRKGYYPAQWGREDAIVMRAPLNPSESSACP